MKCAYLATYGIFNVVGMMVVAVTHAEPRCYAVTVGGPVEMNLSNVPEGCSCLYALGFLGIYLTFLEVDFLFALSILNRIVLLLH